MYSLLKRYKKMVFIIFPVVACILYFGFWATDMYISEARFSLRSPEANASLEWMSLFGQASGGTGTDSYVVQDFVESPAMVQRLSQKLDLKTHYQNPEADFISRLDQTPSHEEIRAYFNKQVTLDYDKVSGILNLQVKAYTPEFAQQMCRLILNEGEKLVNHLSERAVEDSLSLARTEVARAEQRLSEVRRKMRTFREENDLLDPQAEAGSVQGLVGQLEGAAAEARTKLAEARSYLQEDSSQIISIKARIQALEEQIRLEKIRLTGEDDSTISSLAAEYEQLVLEQEFAQKQFMSAVASLESARIRAEQQNRYLVSFVPPTLPEEAMWPKRWYSILVSVACIVLAYALGSLTVAAVREHAGGQ